MCPRRRDALQVVPVRRRFVRRYSGSVLLPWVERELEDLTMLEHQHPSLGEHHRLARVWVASYPLALVAEHLVSQMDRNCRRHLLRLEREGGDPATALRSRGGWKLYVAEHDSRTTATHTADRRRAANILPARWSGAVGERGRSFQSVEEPAH